MYIAVASIWVLVCESKKVFRFRRPFKEILLRGNRVGTRQVICTIEYIVYLLASQENLSILPNNYQSNFFSFFHISATYNADVEDPYPSLSDFHDYEPNLEFDDSDLLQQKHPENDDGKYTFLL